MKAKLFTFAAIISINALAQTGINTVAPNETLEVKGTLRIDELPESGVGEIYNGDVSKNTVFEGTNTVVSDEDGNIGYMKINPNKAKILSHKDLNNSLTAAGTTDFDLTNDTADFFTFLGDHPINIVLPKAKEGKQIFFYIWGGAGTPNTETTFTFTGTNSSPLKRPSASITTFPIGIDWNSDTNATLTLTQDNGDATEPFRYTKIEFICIGTNWFFVH